MSIVSVEERSIFGGLGTAIAECLAEDTRKGEKASLVRLGVQDMFGEPGTADELLQKHGLDPGRHRRCRAKNTFFYQ